MFNKISFVLLACFMGSISCLIRDKGACPSSTALNATESQKFFGKWYEVARVDSDLEKSLKCVTHNIDSKASYETGHPVTQSGLDAKNSEYVYIGNYIFWDDRTVLEYGDLMDSVMQYDIKVVDTDFDNYAVLIACTQIPDFDALKPFSFDMFNFQLIRLRAAWILSRTPTMDTELQKSLVTKLANNGIDESYLIFNELSSCPSNY